MPQHSPSLQKTPQMMEKSGGDTPTPLFSAENPRQQSVVQVQRELALHARAEAQLHILRASGPGGSPQPRVGWAECHGCPYTHRQVPVPHTTLTVGTLGFHMCTKPVCVVQSQPHT